MTAAVAIAPMVQLIRILETGKTKNRLLSTPCGCGYLGGFYPRMTAARNPRGAARAANILRVNHNPRLPRGGRHGPPRILLLVLACILPLAGGADSARQGERRNPVRHGARAVFVAQPPAQKPDKQKPCG